MARKRETPYGPRLTVDPDENILIGGQAILRYLGISSLNTLYSYVEVFGFPAIKRPDGRWMSSMTAIDQWIFLAAEEDLANRPRSRNALARQRNTGHKGIVQAARRRKIELEQLRAMAGSTYKPGEHVANAD